MCDKFIEKLISNMKNSNIEYHLQNVYFKTIKNIIGDDIIKRTINDIGNRNDYIGVNIFKTKWKRKCFIVTNNQNKIYVEFNYKDNADVVKFKPIINFMMICIHQIHSIFQRKSKNFRMIFYLSEEKKKFDKKSIINGELINANSINTGVTIFYNELPTIVVYRKEELLKVLFHELLHLHNTHPLNEYDIYYDNICKTNWNIVRDGSLNLYEAYVEVFAVIIHSFIYAYCHHKDKITLKKFQSVFNREKKYSQDILDDIITLRGNNYLHESTNIFSYFFVKCAIFQNMDLFFESIDKDNYCIIDGNETKYLRNMLENMKKIKKKIKRTSFRMTISDIVI
uniref:Uncharacterized protein n=1 Tax=viral metagenome TaxID=1070528 RepID=A0A6C0BSA5_9ZZZZ